MAQRDPIDLERRLGNVTERLLVAFEELEFLHTMSQALGRPESVQDFDAFLLAETLTLFRAEGGWVSRRSGNGLATQAVQGISSRVADRITERLLMPLAQRGAMPYLVDDLPGALARQPGLEDLANDPDLPRGFLTTAFEMNTELLGVVALAKREPGDVFSAGDSKLLSTLAVQTSLYIRNAELVERFRSEARDLGRRVRQLEAEGGGRPDLSWIKGPSRAMQEIARQVEVAAQTGATVLLLGESGTGKSLVARILHEQSTRRSGPFIEVNCGAVAPTLIESELFGHARGAFTGADRARPGLFEEADRGTIFLDEVAELTPASQVKLLDVLERQRVRRVGENRDRTISARVIAATNADLAAMVREGRFREDLYFRINVISFTLPPLRQRREDVIALAKRFLDGVARETNRRLRGFSPEAETALTGYTWPGNVRELRNVVERSLLLKTKGDRIEREDLALGRQAPLFVKGSQRSGNGPLPDAVRVYEKDLILEALRSAQGNVAKAAALLGISRTNLHNKLRKHDLMRSHTWDDISHDQ
jgi:transcriptional regulator with GAF, ATPase, and Fis domain